MYYLRMIKRLKNIYLYRRVLGEIVARCFKAKYSGSFLGLWWMVITPAVLALSINFIFSKIFVVEIPNYTLFILSAMLPWIFFSSVLSEVVNSFTAEAAILKQAVFPMELVPIAVILASFMNFFIGLAFILPVFIIFNIKVCAVLFFLIFPVIFQLLFMIGLSLTVSCMNVFWKDIAHLLSIGLMLWFWVTPVFYSLDMIPSGYRWISLLNPVSYYMILYRAVLYEGVFPSGIVVAVSFIIGIGSFFTGYYIFLKNEPQLLKRIR